MNDKSEKKIRVRPRKTFHPASTELEDERKYFIQEFKLQKSLMHLLEKNVSLPMKDIPGEYRTECVKLIKAGKITTNEREGVTVVELC